MLLSQDLVPRVLSSLIIAAVTIGVIFYLENLYLLIFLICLGAVLTYEYVNALKHIGVKSGYFFEGGLLIISLYTVYRLDIAFLISVHIFAGLVMGFIVLLFVIFKKNKIEQLPQFWHIIYMFWLVTPLCIFYYIKSTDPFSRELFFIIIIVSVTDSLAYFGGKQFGKHKLMPTVSAGKTIEGAVCGMIGALVFGMGYAYFTGSHPIITAGILSIVLSIVGQAGDLAESKFKRYCGIKDSSNLIPGHGGFIDRLDGYMFVFPAYLLLRFIF